MKKCIYQVLSFCILFLTFDELAMAQPAPPPLPPKSPAPPSEMAEKTYQSDKVGTYQSDMVVKPDQKEVIIRQKGDKDTKIVLEIKNGEYFINGKPLEKFDDQNVIIEKRETAEDGDHVIAYSISPFRHNEWEQAARAAEMARAADMQGQRYRVQSDRYNQEVQRSMQKVMKVSMNEAFLGVSSRKTDKGGATVLEITKGSPAEKAGLKKGDIITKVNEIKIENPDGLYETIHNFKVGDKVKVYFTRDGKSQIVTATLEKSKFDFTPKAFNYHYDFNMPDMEGLGDLQMGGWNFGRPRLGIKAQDAEDGKGVIVLEVTDSSAAWKAGLKKGDIILQVEGKDVNNVNELMEQTMGNIDQQKYTYKLKILRNGTPQEIEVKIPRKLKTAEL